MNSGVNVTTNLPEFKAQLRAIGTYSDASTRDITQDAGSAGDVPAASEEAAASAEPAKASPRTESASALGLVSASVVDEPAGVPALGAEAPAAEVLAAPQPLEALAPLAEPFTLPLADLRAIAQSAGLEWVNSDADKIRVVQEAIAREPKPVHVPRERKPAVVVDEGPLILVETRKDLAQITLPFEHRG